MTRFSGGNDKVQRLQKWIYEFLGLRLEIFLEIFENEIFLIFLLKKAFCKKLIKTASLIFVGMIIEKGPPLCRETF